MRYKQKLHIRKIEKGRDMMALSDTKKGEQIYIMMWILAFQGTKGSVRNMSTFRTRKQCRHGKISNHRKAMDMGLGPLLTMSVG
jgi:hemolysin-activating ACP:hemolysin acyltransferase